MNSDKNLQVHDCLGIRADGLGTIRALVYGHAEVTDSMSAHKTDDQCAPRIGRSISIDRAAALLGVSRRTIYNRISDGHLQTIRTPGGSQRVLIESLPCGDQFVFSVGSEPSGAERRRRP